MDDTPETPPNPPRKRPSPTPDALAELAVIPSVAEPRKRGRPRVHFPMTWVHPSTEHPQYAVAATAFLEKLEAVLAVADPHRTALLSLDIGLYNMGIFVVSGEGVPLRWVFFAPLVKEKVEHLTKDELHHAAYRSITAELIQYLQLFRRVVIERVHNDGDDIHALGESVKLWLEQRGYPVVWGIAQRKLQDLKVVNRPSGTSGNKEAAVRLVAELLPRRPCTAVWWRAVFIASAPKSDDMADAFLMGLKYL